MLALAANVATLILAASGLSISASNLGGTGCVWVGVFASKPTLFAYAKAVMREVRAAIVLGLS